METSICKAVLDVISIETLGLDIDNVGHGTSLLYEAFTKTMQPSLFGHAINYFNSCVPIRRFLPFKETRDHVRLMSAVRTFIRDQVRTRYLGKQTDVSEELGKPDIMQYMIEHSDSDWGEKEIVEYVCHFHLLNAG